jgi:hypothetical protein
MLWRQNYGGDKSRVTDPRLGREPEREKPACIQYVCICVCDCVNICARCVCVFVKVYVCMEVRVIL